MKGVTLYLGLLAGSLALFLAVPQIDIWTARQFWDPAQGFWMRDWLPVRLLYDGIPWITRLVVAVVLFATLWRLLAGSPLWRLDRKTLIFLAASLAVGPGLLANVVLKDEWGRARPSQIVEFGGTRQFSPAALPSDQCERNCSFVAGHPALAFSLVGFALLLRDRRRRRQAEAAALAFGALAGLARMAQGGHFLSDVVFAGLLIYGTTWLLHRWIVERDALASPRMLTAYAWLGLHAGLSWRAARARSRLVGYRLGLWAVVAAGFAALCYTTFDRPVAIFLRTRDEDLKTVFRALTQLGYAHGWLILFGLSWAALKWGGRLPGLARWHGRLAAHAPVPGFIAMALAASGLATDILKVTFGRARPKLLFSEDSFGFGWLGWQADVWSFPSGHATTIAALMTALWVLWPRHLLFYVTVALLVAASRVVIGAHFPSDVTVGAFVGVVVTRYVAWVLERSGVDLAAALRGDAVEPRRLRWRQRLGLRALPPLADPKSGVSVPADRP